MKTYRLPLTVKVYDLIRTPGLKPHYRHLLSATPDTSRSTKVGRPGYAHTAIIYDADGQCVLHTSANILNLDTRYLPAGGTVNFNAFHVDGGVVARFV